MTRSTMYCSAASATCTCATSRRAAKIVSWETGSLAVALLAGILRTHQPQNRQLVLRGRIRHFDVDQEAIHLRLGQRIGALLLDRILRGQDQEQIRQLVRFARDRDLAFLHRLQQRRLDLGRCPIDLVGQDQIAEQRTGLELERSVLFAIDLRAGHVGGQQVGRELHAAKFALDQLGQAS